MHYRYGLVILLAAGAAFAQDGVKLTGHTRDVNAVACSAGIIASGGDDEQTLVWAASNGQKLAAVPGGGSVQSAAISADGKRIATGERYGKVNLLDGSGNLVKVLAGHEASVIAVAFSPDGKTLLSFSLDGGLRTWDANTGLQQAAVKTAIDSYSAATFSPDRKWLAAGSSGGTLHVYNIAAKKEAVKVSSGQMFRALAFSPDGKAIASAQNGEMVRIYSTDGKEIVTVPAVEANGLAYSQDSRILAAAGHDGNIKLIDTASWKQTASLAGHGRTVRAVCFFGNTLVSGSADMTVRLWSIQ